MSTSRHETPMSSPFVETPHKDLEQTPTQTFNRSPIKSKDALQERINALEYELNTEKSERERDRLRHEKSIREYEQIIKDEGKRADELESNQSFLYTQNTETTTELETIKENFRQERADLENKLRQARQESQSTKDEYEEFQSKAQANERLHDRTIEELKTQNESLQQNVMDLQTEIEHSIENLEQKQSTIVEQESEISKLKSEALTAKSTNDGAESAEQVQRELSDQISYSHELEDKIASYSTKIKSLEESDHLLRIVQEEKESLVQKLDSMEELRQRAVDAEMQVVHLQQEKQRWHSYLDKDDNFSSPEDVVRALMRERVEKVGLLDRLGRCEAELSAKDVEMVDDTKSKEEIEEVKMKYEKEANHRARLQRQKEMTARECSFLREQLKSYESEEAMQGKLDEAKAARIAELEGLLDDSRNEIERLSRELAEKEGLVVDLNSPKRRRPRQSEIHDERLSEALRKNRNLQAEFDQAQSLSKQYEQELEVCKRQLASYDESSQQKHRILELRANPTAKYEKIKTKSLEALRAENEDLISQLNGKQGSTKMVPISVVERVRNEVAQLEKSVQENRKSKERLSKVYQKMSTDLRQTVYALLGYQIDPLPNKKVRVKSVFATSEDETLTFVPDLNSKLPKYVGLDDSSVLTKEYENLVTFWVKERKDIPCFLSALNLELYDKTTKASRF